MNDTATLSLADHHDLYGDIFRDSEGNSLLEVQVDPSIYGFHLEELNRHFSLPSCKVGYTSRWTHERMKEWRREEGYENLIRDFSMPAFFEVSEEPDSEESLGASPHIRKVYFSDHSVHRYLENKGYQKLIHLIDNSSFGTRISKEFYAAPPGTALPILSEAVIREAFEDIKAKFNTPGNPYTYYDKPVGGETVETHYSPINDWPPRDYQLLAVNQIYSAFMERKQRKVLLFSPTRTGKSYMAAWAAKRIFDKLRGDSQHKKNYVAVIVSAKVDVFSEHQEAFEGHVDFGKKDLKTGEIPFKVLKKVDLLKAAQAGNSALDEAFASGYRDIVVILSLQDLAGSTKDGAQAKIEHNQIAGRVDLVIADESHFAMFSGNEYRKALVEGNLESLTPEEKDFQEDLAKDEEELAGSPTSHEEALKEFEALNPSIGTLYCSATPYEILMNNNGFSLKENVAIVDPYVIERESEEWLSANRSKPEYLSPYFGIPKTHSYGLHLGEKGPSGVFGVAKATTLNDPESAKRLIATLFGREGGGLQSIPDFFSNADFIASGGGRNILIVLPRKASADRVTEILTDLSVHESGGPTGEGYEIFNISSAGSLKSSLKKFDRSKESAKEIKALISSSERPTITLTVGRLTTGSSVPKWDTVVLLVGGSSIQQRQQAVGRVNTPWISKYKASDGSEIKICEKQNTHVIDFDAGAQYEMREKIDSIYESLTPPEKRRLRETHLSGGSLYDLTQVDSLGKLKLMELTAVDVRKKVLDELSRNPLKDLAQSTVINLMELFDSHYERSLIANSEASLTKRSLGSRVWDPLQNDLNSELICKKCKVNQSVKELSIAWPLCEVCANDAADEILRGTLFEDLEGISNTAAEAEQVLATAEDILDNLNNSKSEVTSSPLEFDKPLESEEERLERLKKVAEAQRKSEENKLKDKVYANLTLIYFYVLLSPEGTKEEQTLQDVIRNIQNNDERKLLASNLGIDLAILSALRGKNVVGIDADRKIFAINQAMERDELSLQEKLQMAMNGLRGFSVNEVSTPVKVVDLVLDTLTKGLISDDLKAIDPEGNFVWYSFLRSKKAGIIDNACKTGVFLLGASERFEKSLEWAATTDWSTEFGDRPSIEELSSLRKRISEKLWAIPTSGIAYEMIKKIYRESGWNEDHIIWDYRAPTELKRQWAYAVALQSTGKLAKWKNSLFSNETFDQKSVKRFDKLGKITRDDWARFAKLIKEKLMNEDGKPKFDAVVGNPPYQVEIGGKSHQVYPEFYMTATRLGKKISMVFPRGWQVSTGKASGSSEHLNMRKDSRLKIVNNYFEDSSSPVILFPDAGTSGVSIVLWDDEHHSNTVNYYEYGEFLDHKDMANVSYWSEDTNEIFNKIQSFITANTIKTMRDSVSGRGPYGVDNSIWTTNDKEESKFITLDSSDSSYIFLGKAKKSKPEKKNILKENPSIRTKNIALTGDKWKIVWTTFAGAAVYRKYSLLEPGELCTNQFLGLFFDTELERTNFESYFKTLFYRFVLSERMPTYNPYREFHEFAPDLSTITNPRTGLVGWESDWTDEDLKILFKDVLTDEDWEYIEKTAIEGDPAGLKK